MSSRAKRKFDIDPNASDPEDFDYDDSEKRAAPQQRRRNPGTPSAKKRPSKRQRRAYGGSDIDEDDEIESDDSFTDRSESEEPEINPATGRSVRRATKKQITYEESEEDEIEDTASDDDEPKSNSRRRAKPSIEEVDKPSLIVKLKMPDYANSRNLRTRTSSKSIARGKTPEAPGTRRSSRLSHDVEAPIVELSDSGRHVNIVREGTRSPESVLARATRGGKGPKVQYPSAIMEASQETSMIRDEESPGPLDVLLAGGETQVQASKDSSPIQEAQQEDAEGEDDDEGMEGVIQESQHEGAAEESEEEGPITRGGRNLRVCLADFRTCLCVLTLNSRAQYHPNASEASTKVATLSPPQKKRRKKRCLNQITAKASALRLRVIQAQAAAQIACEEGHSHRSAVGVTPHPMSLGLIRTNCRTSSRSSVLASDVD